jgi:hypothetical protein
VKKGMRFVWENKLKLAELRASSEYQFLCTLVSCPVYMNYPVVNSVCDQFGYYSRNNESAEQREKMSRSKSRFTRVCGGPALCGNFRR